MLEQQQRVLGWFMRASRGHSLLEELLLPSKRAIELHLSRGKVEKPTRTHRLTEGDAFVFRISSNNNTSAV
jgi:hypothetical protein